MQITIGLYDFAATEDLASELGCNVGDHCTVDVYDMDTDGTVWFSADRVFMAKEHVMPVDRFLELASAGLEVQGVATGRPDALDRYTAGGAK